MEVILEANESMSLNKLFGKHRRPSGPHAPAPSVVVDQSGRLLSEREQEWIERLDKDPSSFAAIELEVHAQSQRQADLFIASLLAKAGSRPALAEHVEEITKSAEVPLRAVEKKVDP